MLGGQEFVKAIPAFYGLGAAEQAADFAVDNMPTFGQQRHIGLRFMSPKSCTPNPGFAFGCFTGLHYAAVSIADFEVVTGIIMPRGLFAWKVGCLAKRWAKRQGD